MKAQIINLFNFCARIMTFLSKKQQLDALHKQYEKCLRCPLALQGRSQVVFGSGNPDSPLMLVGEAPGQQEDLQGEPFVGRSGKLLTTVLASLGVNRKDIFITNIVKCRPPNNRNPLPLEAETCKNEILVKEIAITQPLIICTLGAIATKDLLGLKNPRITRIRGQQFQLPPHHLIKKSPIVIPTLHPSYILRSLSKIVDLEADLQLALSLLPEKK
jgi:DNA polymerase